MVGPGSTADAVVYAENDGLKLRRGTRGIFSNVHLSGWKVGFNVEHDETIAGVGTALKATNVTYVDVATNTKGKNTAGIATDVTAVATAGTATGAGNGAAAPTWTTGWTLGL